MPRTQKTSERKDSGRGKAALSGFKKRALEVFDALEIGITFAGEFHNSPLRAAFMGIDGVKRKLEAQRMREQYLQLRRMRERRLIEARELNGRIQHILTEKGKELYLKLKIQTPSDSESFKTVVTYDVPEGARKGRDAFRYLLKSCGFKRLHYSVWERNGDVKKPLLEWILCHRIEKWVRVLLVQM